MTNIISDEDVKNLNLDTYTTQNAILELSCQPNKLKFIHALIKNKFELDTIVDVTGLRTEFKI